MNSSFASLDWIVFGLYFLLLLVSSIWLSRRKIQTTRDYFVGSNAMPVVAVALSVVATSQSAATFLGAPDYAFRSDLTFIGFYLSGLLAVMIVAYYLIPKFYAIKAVTVYELLEQRYGSRAKRQTGVMFLVGRLFASGARLYIASIAISMILFSDIAALHVAVSIVLLVGGALAYTYFGGVRSVIYSDVIQLVTYTLAGVAVAISLYMALHSDLSSMVDTLQSQQKLQMIQWGFEGGFSVASLLTGWLLLNIAAYGLDQDMTQRVLACRNTAAAKRSIIYSILFTLPIAMLFLIIGLLLFLFYEQAAVDQSFSGEKITVLMHYILFEMPEGLRGFVTVGAIAAALSSTNSVLSAMSSVAVEDLYRPWAQRRGKNSETHMLKAARISVLLFALSLALFAMLSFYWQRYSDLPLLEFALGVMAFAYTGLLGVYAAAIFTKRGNEASVTAALIGGFMMVLLLQESISGMRIGFSWQIVCATAVSFAIMMAVKSKRA